MNELVKTNQNVAAIQPSQVQTSVNFFDPVQFEAVQRMSNLFACSALVPDTYQAGKVGKEQAIANCVIALDIATRIGASPLMVMQNLVIIYGRPSWSSKFLISTVNTCGRFEPLKYRFVEKGNLGKFNYTEYEWKDSRKQAITKVFDGTKTPNIECIAYTTAKGSTEVLESSPISLRMAVEEGWYTKNGSKWQTMPKQMLMYRAASFWTSAYAPELSMGMRTVEEQQDIYHEYEEIKDVQTEVAREKAENANQTTIEIDLGASNGDNKTTTIVDTQTGEIFNQEQEEAPQQGAESTPGF